MASSKKTPALLAKICERIGQGESLREICKGKDMPAMSTVFLWLASDALFSEQYARAREEQADAYADEIVAIADEPPDMVTDANGEEKEVALDAAAIARQRLRIDARKWVASKLKPKKYGDRQEIAHSGNVVFTPNMNLIIEAMGSNLAGALPPNGAITITTEPQGVNGKKPD